MVMPNGLLSFFVSVYFELVFSLSGQLTVTLTVKRAAMFYLHWTGKCKSQNRCSYVHALDAHFLILDRIKK